MKINESVLCVVAMTAALGVAASPAAFASEGHWLHRSVAQSFCVSGVCYSVDHTWAESASGDSGCQNDEIQSFPAISPCISSTASGCAGHREGYNWQTAATTSCNRNLFQACYRNSSPGTYAWNGVCHQATNRALAQTPVPFVNFLPVNGGGLSYNIFHYYGTSWPWGNWYGAPC